MKLRKSLVITAALATSAGVQAQVTGSLGSGSSDFLSLSVSQPCAPCTLGPGVGIINGGSTWTSDLPFAHMPAGGVFENRFLAAGPTSTVPSILNFITPVDHISFLWGSPETFNLLVVNYLVGVVAGSASFTATSLNFAVTNGDQSFAQYVQFLAAAGTVITSLEFRSPENAFEVANFTLTPLTITPVPEPETYALMLTGLGAIGFVARRRKRT